MKIAIDVSQIVYGTGVSVYTKNLVKELLKADSKNDYTLFAGVLRRKKEIIDFVSSLDREVRFVSFPLPPRAADLMWNQMRILPLERFIGHVDIVHTSDWTEPKTKARKVTTVHDLSPLLFPEETNPRLTALFKRKMKIVSEECRAVIVPSETTKSDLVHMGFEKTRITTIFEAPDPQIVAKADTHSVPPYEKYVLTVGTAPRKNLQRTIAAFRQLNPNLGINKLVIVGQRPQHEVDSQVVYTGFVSNSELSSLYSHAEALVYASLYEGFGLPILEAYSLGCPVVTSSIGSMKEVAGSAAVLVDPYDIDSLSRGIEKVIHNRQNYVKQGKIRVKDFSWEKAARETLEVYEQIYKNK